MAASRRSRASRTQRIAPIWRTPGGSRPGPGAGRLSSAPGCATLPPPAHEPSTATTKPVRSAVRSCCRRTRARSRCSSACSPRRRFTSSATRVSPSAWCSWPHWRSSDVETEPCYGL